MTQRTELLESMWEEIDVCQVDAATLAVTDGRVAPERRGRDHLEWSGSWKEIGVIGGYPCAAWSTQEDLAVPVEAQRNSDGTIVALRAEVVNDIVDLDGKWNEVATLPFPTGEVHVCDPYCKSDDHWRPLSIKPGNYLFQVFTHAQEPLGMRILWTSEA